MNIPLPPSEGTQYFSSSPTKSSSPFSEYGNEPEDTQSTPQTARTSSKSRRPTLESIFDSQTPVPSSRTSTRNQPSTHGGKYHPGTRPQITPALCKGSVEPTVHSSHRSSDSSSNEETEGNWETQSDQRDSSSEGEEAMDMDRTIAVNLDTPLSHQVGLFASLRNRRPINRTSPGRTPAKKRPTGYYNNDNPNLRPKYRAMGAENTPKPSSSSDPSLPSSYFANVQSTPLLAPSSPQKLNTLQQMTGNTPLSFKRDPISHNENLAERSPGLQLYDDLINSSPEKEKLNNAQLSTCKRYSSGKNTLSEISSPASRSALGHPSSPIRAAVTHEDTFSPPTLEERKMARRRRETQEFRQFSAIDLEQLKVCVPTQSAVSEILEESENEGEKHDEHPQVISLQQDENLVEEENTDCRLIVDSSEEHGNNNEYTTQPIRDEAVESAAEDIQGESRGSEASIQVPSIPLNRLRYFRSSSEPLERRRQPVADVRPVNTLPAIDPDTEELIASLRARITELEEKLETADVALDRATREIIAQNKKRIHAQGIVELLELERKYGVCCPNGHGMKPREDKLGAAAIQLPGSPTNSVAAPEATEEPRVSRPTAKPKAGSLQTKTSMVTRTSQRPVSRIGAPSREAYSQQVSKKRVREEPPVIAGRKAPVPRPEKRAFGVGTTANTIVGSSTTSTTGGGLAKKPEKLVGKSLRSTAGGGAAARGALARGARR